MLTQILSGNKKYSYGIRIFQRPLIQKIFPQLCAEFIATELVPFILPGVFHIVAIISNDEFAAAVLPQLVPIFTIERPYQVSLIIL